MKRIICLLFLLPFVSNAQQNSDINGDYNGHIDLKTMKLKIVLHLQEDDRRLSGTIDIPEQNAKGLVLDKVKLYQGELSFSIPAVPGNAAFNGQWKSETDSITGTFSQSGMNFPLLAKKSGITASQKPKLSQAARVLKIEAYIDSVMRKGRIAGCAIGIVHNGEIVLNKGFGYRDLDQKIKCDQNTLFAIGSCTKAFTTAVLATLHDDGLFDWETPIKHYVPYFHMKDKFADEQINGIDICTHRSGLPRHDMVWYGASKLDRKEMVERIQYMEPNKPFRTTWQYNNFMFVTAGVVAQEITKETWENLVQKRIFDALEMKDSKVYFDAFKGTSNKAVGYQEKERNLTPINYRDIEGMGPAGCITSSSTDMLKWMQLLLNKGKIGEKQVISASQVEFLLSPKMVMEAGPEFKNPAYALGWMVSQYKGKTMVEHGGNIDGFSADVTLFPEENLGIVVLTNKDGSGIPSLLSLYIADRMLDHEEYDWFEEKMGRNRRAMEAAEDKEKVEKQKTKTKEKSKPVVAKKGPQHPLKDYTGEYHDDAYGNVKIWLKDGELIGSLNGGEMKIKHDQYETFVASYLDMELKMVFFTNGAGRVEWFQSQLEVLSSPITFRKKVSDYLADKTYMDKILGSYDMKGLIITLSMEGKSLMAKASDGQEFELVPAGDDMFKIKGVEGYQMEMVFDEKGNCIKMISHQPNGDFEGVRK